MFDNAASRQPVTNKPASLKEIFGRAALRIPMNRPALHFEYPMYVVSLEGLLSETRMRPCEEMMADGKLREWDSTMEGHTIVSLSRVAPQPFEAVRTMWASVLALV